MMIHRVPLRYAGRGRRVYPGCLQLAAFLSMNPERHMSKQTDLLRMRAKGQHAQADKIRHFYDEYLTTLDMTAERSEEHTSELQSLMRISYAVFCWKKHKTLTSYPEQKRTRRTY